MRNKAENTEATFTCGDYRYYPVEGGAEIAVYTGSDETVVIPAELGGRAVVSIRANAFANQAGVKAVKIPRGVTRIGSYAFSKCKALASLDIPESLTELGEYAFLDCESLSRVTLPQGLTGIPEGAFHSCESLTGIDIPSSVESIGMFAFSGCRSLSRVILREGLTAIKGRAFSGCDSLTAVELPRTVADFGSNPFINCANLVRIDVPKDHPLLEFKHGALFEKPYNALTIYIGCGENAYEIPPGTESVGDYAFFHRAGLSKLIMPDSLRYIGYAAFDGCAGLTEIALPENMTGLSDDAFENCTALEKVTMPRKLNYLGGGVFARCDSLRHIVVYGDSFSSFSMRGPKPEELTVRGNWGRYLCSSLDMRNVKVIHAERPETAPAEYAKQVGIGLLMDGRDLTEAQRDKMRVKVPKLMKMAFERQELLAALCREKLLTPQQADAYLAEADRRGDFGARAMLLDYRHSGISPAEREAYERGRQAMADWARQLEDAALERMRRRASAECIEGLTFALEDEELAQPGWPFEGAGTADVAAYLKLYGAELSATVGLDTDYVLIAGKKGRSTPNVTRARECGVPEMRLRGLLAKLPRRWVIDGGVLSRQLRPEQRGEVIELPAGAVRFAVPEGVTEIAQEAFRPFDIGENSLIEITLPASLLRIGDGAFRGTRLNALVIPDGTVSIGSLACADCEQLWKVTLPASVIEIGENAFAGCPKGCNMVVPKGSRAEQYCRENSAGIVCVAG